MTLHTQVSCPASPTGAGIEFSVLYRPYATPETNGGSHEQPLGFSVTLAPNTGEPAAAHLQAAVAFLIDTAHGVVPAATLARMIGCYYLATTNHQHRGTAITVSLANTHGGRATVRVDQPDFEIERTTFGAAHILHEDDIRCSAEIVDGGKLRLRTVNAKNTA